MSSGRTWQPVGQPAPTELTDARLQTHWAAQLIGAAADAGLEHRADDSHTTMHWDDERAALVGEPIGGVCVALRVANLDLLVLGEDGLVAQMMLNDRRLDEARSWLTSALRSHLRRSDVHVEVRDYDMPSHPVGEGARFSSTDSTALEELATWYANADLLLGKIAAADDRSTPVHVWPHHFDTGAIMVLDPGKPRSEAPQIGYGMSPGDQYFDQPYFYVTPWPVAVDADAPNLPSGGLWQTDGFTGAVLPGTEIAAADGAEPQTSKVESFLRAAIEVGQAMAQRS